MSRVGGKLTSTSPKGRAPIFDDTRVAPSRIYVDLMPRLFAPRMFLYGAVLWPDATSPAG